MHPNRLGIAKFDRLEITCYEIVNDKDEFSHHEYWIDGHSFDYNSLLDKLDSDYPTISRLLFVLGESAFLTSVLTWDPSQDTTRDAFYQYLARQVTNWEDQPRV